MNETHCFNNKFADTVLWWSGSCSYARPMFKFKEKSMWKCYSFWLISVPVNETSSLLVLQTTPTTISAEPVDQNKRERKKNHRTENTFAWWCFLFYFLLIRNSVPSNKLHGRRSPEKKTRWMGFWANSKTWCCQNLLIRHFGGGKFHKLNARNDFPGRFRSIKKLHRISA